MFMGLAERVGLTSFLAPHREGKKEDAAAANDSTTVDVSAATAPPAPPVETEEEKKHRLLEGQKEREIKASVTTEGGATATSSFAKNQRVHYFHKASNVWMEDCYIVGVHHDDGEDQPYYTIRYKKPKSADPSEEDEEEEPPEPIEKQTTHDRLKYAEWDPERTWTILSKTW
jgi:hypothetical protein